MERQRDLQPVNNNRATFVDISTGEIHYEEEILRIDHRDKILRGLEESRKRYERRKRNWHRAEKLWSTASVTMIAATILSMLFLIMVTINAMHRVDKIAFHIDGTVVLICGIVMLVGALATAAQMVAAKVLEKG